MNWTEIRKIINCRDGGMCQICFNPVYGKMAQCHHIDYNKKNNIPSNLITLCAYCHGKTNYNHEHWIEIFKSRMT